MITDIKTAYKLIRRQVMDCQKFAAIFSNAYMEDPLPLLQMVTAIMQDKPIILIVLKGTNVPNNMKLIATKIIYSSTPEDALQEFLDMERSYV